MSIQQAFALVLAALLVMPAEAQELTLKETLIEIPTGSVVSVKLVGKGKLRGKLGSVTDSGFDLQTVKDGKISTQTLKYAEVKSIKHQEKGMSTAAKITLGALAGIGVFFLVLIAIAAGSGWD